MIPNANSGLLSFLGEALGFLFLAGLQHPDDLLIAQSARAQNGDIDQDLIPSRSATMGNSLMIQP